MTESYNRDVALERAAIMLLNAGVWDQAAALFAALLARTPFYSMAWYGLSNALLQLSGLQRDVGRLRTAYSCAMRSLQEDPGNEMATEILAGMRERTPLRDIGIADLGPYPGVPSVLTESVSPQRLTEALSGFAVWTERLQFIMFLGDQIDEVFVPVLVHAFEHDENQDVRMAAIKRLQPWGLHPDVRAACERVAAAGTWHDIEPYFTMGLRGMRTEWSTALAARLR